MPLWLGVPKGGRYKKDANQIIEELKKHEIPFEIKEIDEPDAEPSLARCPGSLVWDYVGIEEIMAFIENWNCCWKESFELKECFLHNYREGGNSVLEAYLKATVELINSDRKERSGELSKAERRRLGYE